MALVGYLEFAKIHLVPSYNKKWENVSEEIISCGKEAGKDILHQVTRSNPAWSSKTKPENLEFIFAKLKFLSFKQGYEGSKINMAHA